MACACTCKICTPMASVGLSRNLSICLVHALEQRETRTARRAGEEKSNSTLCFCNGAEGLHSPDVAQVEALILRSPPPAVGLGHVKAKHTLRAHLDWLTVHCGSHGNLCKTPRPALSSPPQVCYEFPTALALCHFLLRPQSSVYPKIWLGRCTAGSPL